jgi:hypothetical protein
MSNAIWAKQEGACPRPAEVDVLSEIASFGACIYTTPL